MFGCQEIHRLISGAILYPAPCVLSREPNHANDPPTLCEPPTRFFFYTMRAALCPMPYALSFQL